MATIHTKDKSLRYDHLHEELRIKEKKELTSLIPWNFQYVNCAETASSILQLKSCSFHTRNKFLGLQLPNKLDIKHRTSLLFSCPRME